MNWTNHPYFYQVHHPWHWLTYGQNSNAVSSIAALSATAAATIAAMYAIKTYRSTLDQLRIANLQFETAKGQYLEANRPFISVEVITPEDGSGRIRILATNYGIGRAINLRGEAPFYCCSDSLVQGANHVGILDLGSPHDPEVYSRDYRLTYESVDGRKYTTIFYATSKAKELVQSVLQL